MALKPFVQGALSQAVQLLNRSEFARFSGRKNATTSIVPNRKDGGKFRPNIDESARENE